MITILRKAGFALNPNDKVVNSILRMCEKNEGLCPCHHPDDDGDLHCPCDSYKLKDKCLCGLYIKMEKNETSDNVLQYSRD